MGILKTIQPKLLKEFIWPAKMILLAANPFDPFTAFPQDAAQSASNPSVQSPKRPLMAVLEILKPAFQCPVQIGCNNGHTVAVTASGLSSDRVFELLKALLAGPTCASFKVIAKKIKALPRFVGIHDAGLFRVQGQSSCRDQLADLVHRLFCLCFVFAHDDEVIGISNHDQSRFLHRLIHRMKVEVGKQRADDGTLGRTRLWRPLDQTVENILFQEVLDQFQQPSIGYMPLNVLHQFVMRDAVEVGFQVGVHNMAVAGFQSFLDFPQGILTASVRSESVTGRSKPALEDRFDDQSDRRLNDTIPNGWNTQRPFLFASGFIDVRPFDRARKVYPRPNLFAQFVDVFFQFLFKPLDALMIRPGAAPVSLNGFPGGIKGFGSVHFINQAEPNASFHPLFEGIQHSI